MYTVTARSRLKEWKETQTLPMEKLNNARELGGYVMADGSRVRRGLLLRSTQLSDASPRDIRTLAEDYRVRLILDMRGPHEIQRAPDPDLPGARWVHDPIIGFKALRDQISRVQGHIEPEPDPQDTDAVIRSVRAMVREGLFADSYRNYLASDFGQAGFRLFFREILGTEDGAVLWHCATGKDRTGLGSALLLAALGADDDMILADYELSNLYFEEKAAALERLLRDRGEDDDDGINMTLAVLTGVHASFLRGAWAYLYDAWGSPAGYLTGALGVDASARDKLRRRYLE